MIQNGPRLLLAVLVSCLVCLPADGAETEAAAEAPYLIELCAQPLILHVRRTETPTQVPAYGQFDICGDQFATQVAIDPIEQAENPESLPNGLEVALLRRDGQVYLNLQLGEKRSTEQMLLIDGDEAVVAWPSGGPPLRARVEANRAIGLDTRITLNVQNVPVQRVAKDIAALGPFTFSGLEALGDHAVTFRFRSIPVHAMASLFGDISDVFAQQVGARSVRFGLPQNHAEIKRLRNLESTDFDEHAHVLARIVRLSESTDAEGIAFVPYQEVEELLKMGWFVDPPAQQRKSVDQLLAFSAAREGVAEPEVATVEHARLLTMAADLALKNDDSQRAEKLLARATAILLARQGRYSSALVEVLRLQSILPSAVADPKRVVDLLERALRVDDQTGAVSERRLAVLMRLASAHEALRQWTAAETSYRRALLKPVDGDSLLLRTAKDRLALVLSEQHKYKEASEQWQSSLDENAYTYRETADEDRPQSHAAEFLASALRGLALTALRESEPDRAILYWMMMHSFRGSLLGADHPRTIAARDEAAVIEQLGRTALGIGSEGFALPARPIIELRFVDGDNKILELSPALRRELEHDLLWDWLMEALLPELDRQSMAGTESLEAALRLQWFAEVLLAHKGAAESDRAHQEYARAVTMRRKLEPHSVATQFAAARLESLQKIKGKDRAPE